MEQQNEKGVNEILIFTDNEWLDISSLSQRPLKGYIQTVSHLKIYYPFLSRFRSTCIIVIWKLQIIFYSAGNCFPVTFSLSASPQTIQLVWEQTKSLNVKGDYFFIIRTNKMRVEKFSRKRAAEFVHPACLDRCNDESWNKLKEDSTQFSSFIDLSC